MLRIEECIEKRQVARSISHKREIQRRKKNGLDDRLVLES